MSLPPVFIVLTETGSSLAQRLAASFPAAEIHGLRGRVSHADQYFMQASSHIRALFAQGRPLVGICSAAILIRAVGPILGDKTIEPPVIAFADDGSAIVPLLGGHHGGHGLARQLAEILKITAAVTTAGDRILGFSFDDPPEGWKIAHRELVKPVTASLLAGQQLGLTIDHAQRAARAWLPMERFTETLDADVHISAHLPSAAQVLTLHPPVLALGVGCARGTPPEELWHLVEETMRRDGWAIESIAALGSIQLKADEPAIRQLGQRLDVPVRFFSADDLNQQKPRLKNPSEAVFRATGCWGVAEAAALGLAGPDASLVVEKTKSGNATCALALASEPITLTGKGQGIGHLAVIGLGPGHAAGRTLEADIALAEADEIVGYGLYLKLLGRASSGKNLHDFPLGAEIDRVHHALDLAAQGKHVALVCSGDAGIYAMAALVYEAMAREPQRWIMMDVTVIPGVSALQAAASRLGAPLGHDFCAISLSDLLTPWPVIEKRLTAAAQADFVTAFYNPVSMRRREGLEKAREIFLHYRNGDQWVGLGRNLGRPDETVDIIKLSDLTADKVDMLTLVMIGNSQTRLSIMPDGAQRLWTPRGYARKMGDGA